MTYAERIRQRIEDAKEKTLFTASDFADIADSTVVRQNISRLVREGKLRRLFGGVFDKPRFSSLLNAYVAPDVEEAVRRLARSRQWNVLPSGDRALNLLGLSTQVPASYSYVSDGPGATYRLGAVKIEFRHQTKRDVVGLSLLTGLVVQALKTLGQAGVNDSVVAALSDRLSAAQKKTVLRESRRCTRWIAEAIERICGGAE